MTTSTIQGSQERLAQMIGSLDTIATLPEITVRITQCVNDPTTTASDLHRIIAHDPALVSRMLRLVNSAFYSRASQVDSVERAIVLLGFDAVHHLAVAATMGQLFKGARICEGYSGRDLWIHCVAVAATARELARRTGQHAPDEVFLAGLLHDVGLLVSLQVCRGQLRKVCERAKTEPTPFTELEMEIIGVDHQELGAVLAKRWKFPPSVYAVAGHHHAPASANAHWRTMTGLVRVADVLCCQHQLGLPLTAMHEAIEGEGVEAIIPPGLLEQAKEELPAWCRSSIEVLG